MENKIITDWLDKHGNPDIYKKVEDYLEKTNIKDEYIIISKTTIQKRIEELEVNYKNLDFVGKNTIGRMVEYEINLLKQIISQSTPLIPEIEKAFDEGSEYPRIGGSYPLFEMEKEQNHAKQFYISNLKLDI